MNPPKKPGFWRILPLVAIVSLATVATFILRPRRSTENTPPPTAAPHSQTPRSATASAPAPATTTTTITGNTAPTANTPPRPPATPAPLPLLPPLALPNNNTTTAATTTTTAAPPSDAIATLSPRERALLAKIPDARFRDEVLALDPESRARAFKTLSASPPPDADYDCLHVGPGGAFYYACALRPIAAPDDDSHATHATSEAAAAPAAESVSINQPPVRHSRPGSRNVLFLDFSGMNIENSAWNYNDEGTAIKVATYYAEPYNIGNDDPEYFSDQEQKNIIQIWERVAEHYAPFDVDVTTERPAVFTRTTGHALITSATDKRKQTMPHGDTAGGVAFHNVFGEINYATSPPGTKYSYRPALIYYDKLNYSPANIAYAISHELGHNLGLSHDGPGDVISDDPDDNGYYMGHDFGPTSWAPIMGAGYGKNVIQWSKGEYYGANNHEDDIAIITGKLGYIPELGSTTLAAATPLAPSGAYGGGPIADAGVIRQGGNTHYYTINIAGAGSATFALDPCRLTANDLIVGNADLQLDLLNASGNTVATSNPPNALNATLTHPLTTGTWYLRVTTGGAGNPMSSPPTGYTAYGSIGQYTLVTNLVPAVMPLAAALNSDLTWTTQPGSAADWFGMSYGTSLTPVAAQSGSIAPGQFTGITTTVEGPGTLSYSKCIDSDIYDSLTLVITDLGTINSTTNTIRGYQSSWWQLTDTIATSGTHRITWTYTRALNSTSTRTAAWLSQVTWTPTVPFTTTPNAKETPATASQFTITINTDKTWTATTDATWLTPAATAGTGPATLTITCDENDTPAPRFGHITITSGGINRTIEVAQPVHIPLATALGNDLGWQTDGDNNWFAQTITTRPGRPYAARSGIIFGTTNPANPATAKIGQQTALQATVTGTGTLDFHWKVSSEAAQADETGTWGDILHFYIDGQERAYISGEQDWARYTTAITTPGTHTLRWIYQKDPYLSAGADAAWLDQVAWTSEVVPTLNISPNALVVPPTKGDFPLIVDSNIPWTATTTGTWLTITPATGNGHATPNLAYSANTTAKARTGIITLTGGGLTVTSTITQDTATASTLTLSPATKQVPATAGTFALAVNANTAWKATSNASWLTISSTSGTATATLTATHAANTATTTRTATITVTGASTTATCTVTQAAATTSGTNNNGSTNTGGNSGGGGAPSLWSLLALTLLLALHAAKRKNCPRKQSTRE